MIKINGNEYSPTIFPDKTSQVWHIPDFPTDTVSVNWDFDDESEIIQILQLIHLIELTKSITKCTVMISYCPYARQHHEVSNDKTFALNTFFKVLNHVSNNNLKFKFIIIDIHNTDLLNMFPKGMILNIIPSCEIEKISKTIGADVLLFPDEGAKNRYSEHLESSLPDAEFVFANKVRDSSTGNILEYQVNHIAPKSNVLVVDDICDGGATFIHLANAVKKFNLASLHLYVTHGIFSRGMEIITSVGYNSIWTVKGKVK